MIKAELKYLHSPDIHNLQTFYPEVEDNFGFSLQIIAGREGCSEDGESFDVFVCTPKWLLENHSEGDIVIGLHHIIVFEYTYKRMYDKISQIIRRINATSWQEFGLEFGKFGRWEFENYQG